MQLPCKHVLCASCCLDSIKVSKIKKSVKLHPNVEPLKCPYCSEIHIIKEKDKMFYEEFKSMCLKKIINKQNADKKHTNIYKRTEFEKELAFCCLCPITLKKAANPATHQCLTCLSLYVCETCKAKHLSHPGKEFHVVCTYKPQS